MAEDSLQQATLEILDAEQYLKELEETLKITRNDHKIAMLLEKIKEAEVLINVARSNHKFYEMIAHGDSRGLIDELSKFRAELTVGADRANIPRQKIEDLVFKIDQKIRELRVTRIKQTILDLGLKYVRLQVAEIAEKCDVPQEDLIISTLQDMISRGQIAAEYFKSTRAVAFNQLANIQEKDKFVIELEKEFATWRSNVKKS